MRLTPLAWLMIAAFVAAVVVLPLSQPASLILGVIGALLALTAVSDALGYNHNVLDYSEHRRSALRRLFPGRNWDRKAPDHADEPPDAIWERERKRRGLG